MPDHLTRAASYPDRPEDHLGLDLIDSIHNYCGVPAGLIRPDVKEAFNTSAVLPPNSRERLETFVSKTQDLQVREEEVTTEVITEDQPLSLVVRKEDTEAVVAEPQLSEDELNRRRQLKIRDFAKELTPALPQQQHRLQQHQQQPPTQHYLLDIPPEGILKAGPEEVILPKDASIKEANKGGITDIKSNNNNNLSVGSPPTTSATNAAELACDFCDKKFSSRSHLNSHVVVHTGERAFSCPVCSKDFARKSTLRAHMTTHTKHSNFMCEMCEKACNDKNSLEEHRRMHTGEKPFVCSVCSKAYARKSHLNVHFRVHTGERPFACVHCEKDFTEKRFLNDHIQTAHTGKDGPLKCPNCAREFAYKTSLKQHLKKRMCERNKARLQQQQMAAATAPAATVTAQSCRSPGPAITAGGNSSSAASGSSSGSSSGGSSCSTGKQFKCPFCEKSYSWKQTLKQHVSMYHRNKVNTDEFWKYELVKNRFSEIDASVKEVLWKKQLGRHLEEAGPNAKVEVPSPTCSGRGTPSIQGEPSAVHLVQPAEQAGHHQQGGLAPAVMLADNNIAQEVVVTDDSQDLEQSQEDHQVMDCSEQHLPVGNHLPAGNNNQNNVSLMNEQGVVNKFSVQSYALTEPRKMSTTSSSIMEDSSASSDTPMAIDYSVRKVPTPQEPVEAENLISEKRRRVEASAEESDRGRRLRVSESDRSPGDSDRRRNSGVRVVDSELIRMLVSGRVSVDNNNNNNNVTLRVDSPVGERIRSPVRRFADNVTPTRELSPLHMSRLSQTARLTPQPALQAALLAAPPMARSSLSSSSPSRASPQPVTPAKSTKPALEALLSRASTPVKEQHQKQVKKSGNSSGSNDNSLLKALLLKNSDSTSCKQQALPMFPLPEKNNILRKRLLGICDEDKDSSKDDKETEDFEQLAIVEDPLEEDARQNNEPTMTRVEEQAGDEDLMSHADDHSQQEMIRGEEQDMTSEEEPPVKCKVPREEDYKHRSVLKVLLYRYNTSHHL